MVAVHCIVCKVADFNTVEVGVHDPEHTIKRVFLPIAARDDKEQECKEALEELLPVGTPVSVRDPNFQNANPTIADISVGGASVVKELLERGIATLWNMPLQ